MMQKKLCFINPSAIHYKKKYYVLFRGESYPIINGTVTPNLALSTFSYWLREYDLEFNLLKTSSLELIFKSFCYKELGRGELGSSGEKGLLEDVRMIPQTVSTKPNGDLCALGTYSLICQSHDSPEKTSLGPFRSALCEVNISRCKITHLGVLDEKSQVGIEKNWVSVWEDNFYLIRSFFPLRFSVSDNLLNASFVGQKFNPPSYRNSCQPIKLDSSTYLSLCHRRISRKVGVNDYQYYFLKFKIVSNSVFIDSPLIPVSFSCSGLYCSSMCNVNGEIIIFSGKNDLDFTITRTTLPLFP